MKDIRNLEELFFNSEKFLAPIYNKYRVKGYPINEQDALYYKEYERDWYFRTYKEVIFGGLVWVRKIFNSPLNDLKLLKFEFGRKKQWFNAQIVKTGEAVFIDGEKHYPFINISYSYNAVNAIKFEIGFYRFACQNGVVSGYKELGKLKITPENLFEVPFWANPCLLSFFTNRYETQIIILKRTKFSYQQINNFLKINFKSWEIPTEKTEIYTSELGTNAYALLNILSDSATHSEDAPFETINEPLIQNGPFETETTSYSERAARQRRVGEFLEKLSAAIEKENNKEKYIDINNPEFKLTSGNIDLVEKTLLKEEYHFDLLNWKF